MHPLARPLGLLACAALAVACRREDPRPNLLLITLDTTRADALGCYAPRPGLTPHLDALARESIVFESARTVAPLTLPAHASMVTGLNPPRHGVRDNGLLPLPASALTLAEIAGEARYDTAAFVSAAVLDASWGIAQGFATFDAPPPPPPSALVHLEERSGDETVARTLAWLDSRDDERPFCLWMHLFDPHAPYAPAPEHLARANGDAYLGEIAATDAQVGRVIDALRARGELERTFVVVVADHGEALGQHGEPTHSVFMYEPVARVPLIVRAPGRAPGRSRAHASVVDVLPTLLTAAGCAVPPAIDGRDLLAPADPSRAVYFESYCGWLNYGWSTLCGAARGDAKYVWSGAEELFDLSTDAREKKNLASERREECASWRAAIGELVAGPTLERDPSPSIDSAARERIRGLGYAGAAEPETLYPAPLEPTSLPPPLERKQELAAWYAALEAETRGDRAAAEEKLRAVLASNPGNYSAGDVLGALLAAQGRHREAVEVLEKLQKHARERVSTHRSLAASYAALGDAERELAHLERAVELQPQSRDHLAALERAYEAAGKPEAARAVQRRARALDG